MNSDPGDQVNEGGPAIAVSPNGTVHVVWTGDESQKTVWTARSTDGGATFSAAVRVNDVVSYPPSYSVFQPDIAVGADGTVYVVWFDYRAWLGDFDYGSPIDVYLDKSTDDGVTWNTDVLVSVGGSGTYPWHYQPYMALDPASGNIYVAFNDLDRYGLGDPGDVSLARSIDGGATFQPKVRVDDLPDGVLTLQAWPAIAVSPVGGEVYVGFEDSRGTSQDIRLARSTDQGVTFGANTLVNADTTGPQLSPTLAVTPSGAVCAAWFDWSTDTDPSTAPFVNNILFARSADGGAAFGSPVTLNDATMNADYGFDWPPRLAVDRAGIVHATWFDRRADTTLCFYDHSTDGGASFGADVVVSHDRGPFTHALPRITTGGNDNPCITWVDRRNGTNFDVFYAGRRAVTEVRNSTAVSAALRTWPNPFSAAIVMRFSMPRSSSVRIEVRDVQGRATRTLVDENRTAGTYTVTWDGLDDGGRVVPPGIYFLQLEMGGASSRARVVRLE
ncbi:MAG: FlgD immunoglobulin-like domain containing protein [Candidatus Eisenbacteria bacterium]